MKYTSTISFFLSNLLKNSRPNSAVRNSLIFGLLMIGTLAYGQDKSVIITGTFTEHAGVNYHALEGMTLDEGFIYDSGTSGLFYAETGDFPNPEPVYNNRRNKTTTQITKEATTSETELNSWGKDKKHSIIQFSDGLGRTVQSVYKQGSPLGNDLVQHFEYDQQGRGSKAFLPYNSGTTANSLYTDAAYKQALFYNNSADDIADSSTPFSEAEFDNSPLGRVLKNGAPGEEWQLTSGNTAEFTFKTNDNGSIRKFDSNGSGTTTWNQDDLIVSQTTDENGHKMEQYSDKIGRLILNKVEQQSNVWSFTYHVYDDMGRMIYTIQPEGYEKMVNDNNYHVSHVLSDYVFAYNYDDRGRLIEKQVPGADPVYYIYDALDRVVLMQDGILRAQNKWTYTKYDFKNRVVTTGFHVDGSNTTRASKQTNIDAFNYGTVNHFEERNTSSSTEYYTNRSYPTSGNTVQMVYYYDNYNFDGVGAELDHQYTSQGFGNEPDYQALNRVTATKQKILGETTWLWNVTFYDRKGRPIQSKSNNQRQSSLNDLVTTKYHFDGRVEHSKRYVDAGASGNIAVDNRFEYDDTGRLIEIYQTNPSDTEQQIAAYHYNELGQLTEKELHEVDGEFLQSVDLRYNIRGWLTKINGSDLSSDDINSGDNQNDIFGIDLLYTSVDNGISNSAFHNGNISAVKWNTNDHNSTEAKRKRSYAFDYDYSDRLLAATYKAHNGTDWTTEEQNAYNVSGITYDKNGNIGALNRNYQADESSSAIPIDELIYTYSGNRLTKVDDGADDDLGFKENSTAATEYSYDSNGNILIDLNKGLTYSYNDLNKTQKVSFSSTKYIEYTHTSAGARIEKHVRDDAASIDETWYYIKGFVFKDNDLDHFAMSEGVVRKVDGDLRYEYFLTDHQGNTRMSFTTDVEDVFLATMETSNSTAQAAEEALFENVVKTRHPDGQFIAQTGPPNSKLSFVDGIDEVNGGTGQIGLAKSLKVGKGDVVYMSAWGRYTSATCGANCSDVDEASLTSAIAALFGGIANVGGEAQAIFDGIDAGIVALFSTAGRDNTGSGSKVYLNWLLFDENYSLKNQGFQEVPTTATLLNLTIPTIEQDGYVYVYLSNESGGTQKAYFDDFYISHTKKVAVLQENHYYPFGLSFKGVAMHVPTPSNTTANKYLYNSGSEQVELDIRNYDTHFRQLDPALGRFQAIDPLAGRYDSQTPYNYAFNDPIALNDPNGDSPVSGPVGHRVNYTDPYMVDRCGSCVNNGTYQSPSRSVANYTGSLGAGRRSYSNGSAFLPFQLSVQGKANLLGNAIAEAGSAGNSIVNIDPNTGERSRGFVIKYLITERFIDGYGNELSPTQKIEYGLDGQETTDGITNAQLRQAAYNNFPNLMSQLGGPVDFIVDRTGQYTRRRGNGPGATYPRKGGRNRVTIYIESGTERDSKLLKLVLGHEINHAIHRTNPIYQDAWESLFGFDASEIISEYLARKWELSRPEASQISPNYIQKRWENFKSGN